MKNSTIPENLGKEKHPSLGVPNPGGNDTAAMATK